MTDRVLQGRNNEIGRQHSESMGHICVTVSLLGLTTSLGLSWTFLRIQDSSVDILIQCLEIHIVYSIKQNSFQSV